MMVNIKAILLAMVFVFFASFIMADAKFITPDNTRISHFSDRPVPRFESLRRARVNGRVGPTFEHDIRWQYQQYGLPVMIIKESVGWWKIRDPDGDEVWVHASLISERPTAIIKGKIPVMMYRTHSQDSQAIVRLAPGSVVKLIKCERNWCHLSIKGKKGWVQGQYLWGSGLADEFKSAKAHQMLELSANNVVKPS